jgi:hypothetical protein
MSKADDYPQDAIDRVLGKPGAGRPIRPDDADRIYLAAGCPCGITHTHVAEALARGLEAQRALDEIKEAMLGLTSRAKTCRDLAKAQEQGPARNDLVAMASDMSLTAKASAYEHAHELLTEALARVLEDL